MRSGHRRRRPSRISPGAQRTPPAPGAGYLLKAPAPLQSAQLGSLLNAGRSSAARAKQGSVTCTHAGQAPRVAVACRCLKPKGVATSAIGQKVIEPFMCTVCTPPSGPPPLSVKVPRASL
jgi:hypothetical protein